MLKKYLQEIQEIDIITYESGDPFVYKNDFSKLWLEHMKYLSTIERFPYKIKFSDNIFMESLSRFKSKHKYSKLFVAKEGLNMIGFLQAGIAHNNTYAFISDFHIREGYRGRNIGETLMNNCLKWFCKHNINECDIKVTGGNEKVLDFYRKYGFDVSSYTLKRIFYE